MRLVSSCDRRAVNPPDLEHVALELEHLVSLLGPRAGRGGIAAQRRVVKGHAPAAAAVQELRVQPQREMASAADGEVVLCGEHEVVVRARPTKHLARLVWRWPVGQRQRRQIYQKSRPVAKQESRTGAANGQSQTEKSKWRLQRSNLAEIYRSLLNEARMDGISKKMGNSLSRLKHTAWC